MSNTNDIEISLEQKNLLDNLKDHKIDSKKNNKTATNTSFSRWCASYRYESIDEYEEFFDNYQSAISKGAKVCITEQHHDMKDIPILIDYDFRYENKGTDSEPIRAFTDEGIIEAVKLHAEAYDKYVEIPSEDKPGAFMFMVFYRDGPYKKGNEWADGFHVMGPELVTSKEVHKLARAQVVKKFDKIAHMFDFKNTVENLIDKSVMTSTGWCLYGSSKKNLGPYKLRFIVDRKFNIIPAENLFEIDENLSEDNLAKYLSIRLNSRPTYPMSSSGFSILESNNSFLYTKKSESNKRRGYTEAYDFDMVRKLVEILDTDRAEDYNKWIQVIWCIHNINPDDERLKDLAISFSKRSDKYKDGDIDELWEKAKKEASEDVLTIGSLHYWAKLDDQDRYDAVCQKQLQRLRESSLKGTNGDVAMFFVFTEENNFIYSRGAWFFWDKHRWREDEEKGMCLRNKVRPFIDKYYLSFIEDVQRDIGLARVELNKIDNEITELGGDTGGSNESDEMTELKNDIEQIKTQIKSLTKKQNKILDVIAKLNTTSFKDNVIKECKELFHDPTFTDHLDTNPDLLGFENGIYDLKQGIFRDGNPEDYITMSTGYNYKEYDPEDPNIPEIEDFMEKVFPDEDTRAYMLQDTSSYIDGHNFRQKIRIWSGTGGNGKSIYQNLIKLAMGEYTCKLNISLLTKKRPPSNVPQPDLMASMNKRWAYMDEPNENDKMNIGFLKELTGGDTITGRNLYDKKQTEFIPCFKLVLCCNKKPKGPTDDGGFARRLELVEYVSRFVYQPSTDNEFEFLRDDTLKDKLPYWKETFMSMLVNEYKTYSKNNYVITIPEAVDHYTQEYIRENDKVGKFLKEMVEPTPKRVYCSFGQLYDAYREWCSDEYGCDTPLDKNTMRSRIEMHKPNEWINKGRNSGLRNHIILPLTIDPESTNLDDILGIDAQQEYDEYVAEFGQKPPEKKKKDNDYEIIEDEF